MVTGPYLLGLLVLAIVFIILATAKLKFHPFLVLLITAYAFGLLAGVSPSDTIAAITRGFGSTLSYIGIVIAAGTIIGSILERSGGALVMAKTVIRLVGHARSALAMSITGAVVSIPVFCDSGFVLLSPLNRSLAERSGSSMALFAVALSMGHYATHVFVPPTPGPIAAAGELGADIGTVILLGLTVSLPVIAVSYLFARYMGKRIFIDPRTAGTIDEEKKAEAPDQDLPSPLQAFAPVFVPVLLIALRSIAEYPTHPFGEGGLYTFLGFIGDPNTALILGVFLAFLIVPNRGEHVYSDWVGKGLREAGIIILITGAGGSLGGVLRETPIGEYLSTSLASVELGSLSLLVPFIIAAALKTALGSSTVAIITTASLMAPLIGSLGMATGMGPAFMTLAIGAGSMTVSHANDSYFWVVSQFSGMTVSQAYKLQTVGSGIAGLTGIMVVLLLGVLMR